MRTRLVVLVSLGVIACAPMASAASGVGWLIPPVDGPIAVRFDAPAGPYSPGHRGVDYAVATGTRVRAAAPGTVAFAGSVAGIGAVTVRHGGGIETTYSRLATIEVVAGQSVQEGTWIGTAGEAHAGEPGLHFGVKVEGVYVDPVTFLGPVESSAAIHLAPLVWQAGDSIGEPLRTILSAHDAGDHELACVDARPRPLVSRPPNDNIAVAVAGIASKTAGGMSADMYEHGPELLGYPERRIYRFSYAGARGPDLHRPYERVDTYGDLRAAATRLGVLLEAIAARHPGRQVDLIAHSQGGIVARTYLTRSAAAYDQGRPAIEHLVTFASPHEGAPLASTVDDLERSIAGRALVTGLSRWARSGARMPDPRSPAVRQLAPGSPLLGSLAAEDVLVGTRVLTLGIANDVIVPADRTNIPGELGRIVPPQGINGHSAVVGSAWARAQAYDFLRGASPSCPGAADRSGHYAGSLIGWAEARLGELLTNP